METRYRAQLHVHGATVRRQRPYGHCKGWLESDITSQAKDVDSDVDQLAI